MSGAEVRYYTAEEWERPTLQCAACGAWVWDSEPHTAFHERLDRIGQEGRP